jgi:hypothetical protein
VRSAAIQQSLAADGAIAFFSSNLFLRCLNADRAPQLKRSVMRAKSSVVLFLTLWATAHVVSFYWVLTNSLHVPRCRGNCFVVSELARILLGEAFLMLFLGTLLPLFADLGLGVMAHSWRQFLLFVVLAVLALQVEGLLLDWMGRRWSGLMQDYYGWAREIFFRFALPAIFVSVGTSAGAVKRRYLFVPRSKHA